MRLMGQTHPLNEVRIENIRDELLRWARERERVLAARQRA